MRSDQGAAPRFRYEGAFCRNLGVVSEDLQARLRRTRIGMAGLGGSGGCCAEALVRLGVGAMHLADPDVYELVNFNRQPGARLTTVGRSKVDASARLLLDVNPELDLRRFPEGVTEHTLTAFLEGVDLVVAAYGGQADDSLYREAKQGVAEADLIGDALAPRRLMDAILDGARAGRRI